MLLHSIPFIHVYAVYTSEIAVNLRQCPSVSTRNARIGTKTYRHRSQMATGYVCIKVARVFSQRLGNFLCQYWMVIILSAPILWLQRGLLECVSVVLFYFLKRALKALRVVISEPTPLRDRQSLSDSMERISKWTHAADSSFVESAANTSRNPEKLPYQIVTMFHSAEV